MNEAINRVKKAAENLYMLSVCRKIPVEVFISEEVPYKKTNNAPPDVVKWEKYDNQLGWGGKKDAHWWFRVNFEIPEEFKGKEIRLCWEEAADGCEATNPQFLVYEGGSILSGMDTRHKYVVLSENSNEVFIYAYSGMKVERRLYINTYLYCVDKPAEQLYYDFDVYIKALETLDGGDYRAVRLGEALNGAADLLDLRTPYSAEYYDGIERAGLFLQKQGKMIPDGTQHEAVVHCVGHSHIDVAWLWTVEQSEEKVQRTFATALNLMNRYSEYRFMATQPHLYACVKRCAPELYERIKEKVARGYWQPEGGMWVEADCNLPCGESLIRQIYYGKKFFKEEFGIDSKIIWLPDTFGFPATLPQIFKQCGIELFVTSKLSWNDRDRYPHDLFSWQGTDGSEITSCLLTAPETGPAGKVWTTYNAMADPGQLKSAWKRFADKKICNEIMLPFGYGDGGGGPTAEHLENIRRMRGGVPGCPTAVNSLPGQYFSLLRERVKESELAVWRGELYLEFHRGTYSSMARNKRANRKYEYRLRRLELCQSICSMFLQQYTDESKQEEMWKLLLLNQFHDILPGSGVEEVYEESDRTYEKLEKLLSKEETRYVQALVSRIGSQEGYLALNPNDTEAYALVRIKDKFYKAEGVPAKGWKALQTKDFSLKNSVLIGARRLENECIRVLFDDCYEIVSVFDKRIGREMIRSGENANALTVYDAGFEYEFNAWEMKEFYRRMAYEVRNTASVCKIDEGVRKGFRILRRYRSSTIEQYIYLEEDSGLICFDTKLDWNEPNSVLKTRFPMRINAEYTECDIQFGTVKRPVFRNTSWEKAKFEVCAHKFADLSQGDCGVALINDCKYGYDFIGGALGLTLLKTSDDPNPKADIGAHEFRYALYTHEGSFAESDVGKVSNLFNDPVCVLPLKRNEENSLPQTFSFVRTDRENLFVETIKPSGGGYLVRAYEGKNRQTDVCFTFGARVTRAERCDCLENPVGTLAADGNKVRMLVAPYELITLRVYLELF